MTVPRSLLTSLFYAFVSTTVACGTSSDPTPDGSTGGNDNATGGSFATGGSAGDGRTTGGAAAGGTASGSSNTGGTAAGGSTGGTPVLSTEPCEAGSVIEAVTPDAGKALFGTVFGTSFYEEDQPSTYNPEKISIKVTNGGAPVANCEVAWLTETGNGWVFPDESVTDENGVIEAHWTAGNLASEKVTATIALVGGGKSEAAITGSAKASEETRGDSIHFTSYPGGTYSEYKVRVTPLTDPETTYYETNGFIGAYGGIQFTSATESKMIFSVWDTGGKSSKIMDDGACNATVSFGGEGTGTSCRLQFPPSKFGAIAGLPNDYMLKVGDTYETHLVVTFPSDCGGACTDYAMTFTDVTRGFGPISLGTQRYMAKVNNNYNDIFIEDWSSKAGDDCIGALGRTAYFHDMQAKIGGIWQPIQAGSFNPNFVPTNHEICSNYFAGVDGGKFLLSSGGADYVGPPLFDSGFDLELP